MAPQVFTTKTITKTPPEFIRDALLPDLRRMVYDLDLHYLAFEIIAVGIELLGACDDPYDWEESRHSEKRFELGMKRMSRVNARYDKYCDAGSHLYLYKHLRCGIAHIMRPQKSLLLSQRDYSPKGSHLTEISGHLTLVCEDFYDDFAASCNALCRESSTINAQKLHEPFWNVYALYREDGAVINQSSTAPQDQNFVQRICKLSDQT
jgi:hypothetical protein